MNNLLEKNGSLILNANPHYENYIYHLELKTNNTFRLIKCINNCILYDSYGNFIIDDNNNILTLEFTEIEEDFHKFKSINIIQQINYQIIKEEKVFECAKKYKSLNTIIFNNCPHPFNYKNRMLNNENIFYCDLEYI
jgi:hypothetical protein